MVASLPMQNPSPTLTVDLGAIAENVRRLRGILTPATEIIAVIKANAYGLGSVDVATAALAGGATRLAVARGEEVRVLRAFEVRAPILVLGESPTELLTELAESDTSFTVWDRGQLPALTSAARAARRRIAVHIKVDTGMHRLGVDPEDAIDLAAEVAGEPLLTLAGVFTHFGCADEPDQTPTFEQWRRFEGVLRTLAERGIPPGIVHAANTAAALRFPQVHASAVRVGIGLAGISPVPNPSATLMPSVTLRATVIRVATLKAGEGVGYGLTDASTTLRRIATVAIGYADGVRRGPSAARAAILSGHVVPRVGRVSMDLSTYDVTSVSSAMPGDIITLLGREGDEEIRVERVAEETGTIPWEVLTSISPRVRRVPIPLPHPEPVAVRH